MSKPDDDERFLSRWSRMKRSGTAANDPAVQALNRARPGAGAPDTATETGDTEAEEPLDLETLPNVDEMTAETDVSVFLDKRVPAFLRNAALSKMWTLDPTIRDFIEVAENQWNWNIPGGAPFYEEMLPGTGLQTFMADATSAMVRSVEEVLTSASTQASVETSRDRDRDLPVYSSSESLALQHEIAPLPVLETRQTVSKNEVGATPSPAIPEAVALQQEMPAEPLLRRRHGGALPT